MLARNHYATIFELIVSRVPAIMNLLKSSMATIILTLPSYVAIAGAQSKLQLVLGAMAVILRWILLFLLKTTYCNAHPKHAY